jgi:hypothetical protein
MPCFMELRLRAWGAGMRSGTDGANPKGPPGLPKLLLGDAALGETAGRDASSALFGVDAGVGRAAFVVGEGFDLGDAAGGVEAFCCGMFSSTPCCCFCCWR